MRAASKTKIHEIQSWLDVAIEEGAAGDQLPTAKALMKRFYTGQKSVQAAIAPYIENGILVSRRGLGTIIAPANRDDGTSPLRDSTQGDVLVLRRTSENAITPHLIRSLEQHLQDENFMMLQVGYANEDQALEVLSSLGRFKSCLLQSHFHKLSIDFLAALNDRVQHIVVDGAYVSGVDVDSISTDWRRAMLDAFRLLRAAGHERIALLTSAHSAQTLATVKREFRQCSQLWSQADNCPIILLDALPGDYRRDDIVVALEAFRTTPSCLEFSALVTWGVVEGVQLDMALRSLGIAVPGNLSVVMLGSSDSPAGHLLKFDVIGGRDQARLACCLQVLREHMSGVNTSTKNYYMNVETVRYGSVANL